MEVAAIYPIITGDQQLIDKANEYIKAKGISKEEFAKEISYSRPAVSQFLNGKYESKSGDIRERIAAHLNITQNNSSILKPVEIKKPSFFESRDAANIIGVCNSCQKYSGLGAIVGKSGFGKTFTLEYYGKLPKVAYVVCNDAMNSKDLLAKIERSIGLPIGTGTNDMRANKICEFFDINRGYLLIIDEADKLLGKYTQKKMEILRGIFDGAKVGMIVAGEEQLESLIKSYIPRFANRIEFYYKMKGLTAEEIREYLGSLGPEFSEDVIQEIIRRGTNLRTGCFRLFDRTLNNILRILDGDASKPVALQVLDKASEMMML